MLRSGEIATLIYVLVLINHSRATKWRTQGECPMDDVINSTCLCNKEAGGKKISCVSDVYKKSDGAKAGRYNWPFIAT